MSSIESLFKSFIIMLVCLFSSVMITQFILMPAELVRTELVKTGISDAPPEWGGMGISDFTLSLGYFLTYFLDFYAVGQFVWTSVRRQRYDVYGNPVVEEGL